MSDTAFIIQARLGSTRLSNKVILPFFKGHSILELLVLKLTNHFNIPVIVATTTNKPDDKIVENMMSYPVHVFRGSENDVLDRFIKAAKKYHVKRIIRICADNPFLSSGYLKLLIDSWTDDYDYSSFILPDGTPSIQTHYGFWAEMVSLNALEKIQKRDVDFLYREHVTNYIYIHPDKFRNHYELIPDWIASNKKIRLTLDTPRDFELQKEIYMGLSRQKEEFDVKEVIAFLEENPVYLEYMEEIILQNKKK